MCGIVGGIGLNSAKIINSNINLLKRRGPDHQAVVTLDNGLTLGSTRLSMTDPHPRSNQPMIEKISGNMLVFNGEVYNHKFIRKNLENHGVVFETKSDTEVVLKALTFHGTKIISTFEGMFAFTFYDKKRNLLIMSRDYLGKKPIYFYIDQNKFFFSSQVNFIKKYINNHDLNLESIKTYLQLGYLVDPSTMYQKISSVMPGEILIFDLNILSLKQRYSFTPDYILDSKNIEISAALNNALLERVADHDKFAISLSGGIDSSILAMQCSKLGLHAQAYSMSWVDSDKEKYQLDALAAKKIASITGLNHKVIEMPKADKLDEILTEYVLAMGEPNSNPTGLSMMILYSEIAKDKHRLVLTGDGADEVFGGYKRYELANRFKFLPEINTKVIRKFLTSNPVENRLLKGLLLSISPKDTDEYWLYWHLIAREKYIDQFISNLPIFIPKVYGKNDPSKIYNRSNNASGLMSRDLKTWLPMESNRKLDRISMWYSIEARSPYQSERVIGIGNTIMEKYNFEKVRKELLFDSFPKISTLPTLSSKSGFISPLGYWLRSNPEMIRNSIESLTQYLPFDKIKLLELGRSPEKKNYSDFKFLWSLIVLNRWLSLNK